MLTYHTMRLGDRIVKIHELAIQRRSTTSRDAVFCPEMVFRRRSECEAEDRPLPWYTLGPHSSAGATYDSFHGGQPESAPRVLSPGMEPVEGFENYFVVGIVEADPVVPDMVRRDIPLVFGDAQLDPRVVGGPGVLPGILQPASKLRRVRAAFGGFP